MKKVFKANLFFFIIGCIISSLVITVALNIDAEDIEYNENESIKDKLDNLFNISNYQNYEGNTYLTPGNNANSVNTTNKIMENDFVIKQIPSYYKILSNEADITADDVKSGKKAYNNDSLITGIATTSPSCESGSFTCTTCNTSTGQTMPLSFKPKRLVIMEGDSPYRLHFYDKSRSETVLEPNLPLSTYMTINSNSFIVKNFNSDTLNHKWYYFYCK